MTKKPNISVMASDINNIKNNIDSIRMDIRDIKNNYETRIRSLEDDHTAVGGVSSVYQRFVTLEKEWNDFNVRWKTILVIASAVSSVVTFALTFILGN